MNSSLDIVFITCPTESIAHALARGLVEARLAACVQVLPGLISYYWWEGHLQQEPEVLLLAKTSAEAFRALQDYVVANHPYDVPQIVSVPASAALPAYRDWVRHRLDVREPGMAERKD